MLFKDLSLLVKHSPRAQKALATRVGNQARRTTEMTKTYDGPNQKGVHKAAGQENLKAVEFYRATGQPEKTRPHLEAAAEHAAKAGDWWDEAKHPRDAAGKFT